VEIKLTLELEKPKDTDRKLVLAAAGDIFRPIIEELKDSGSKAAYPLVSMHSDWAIEVDESDWECDFFGGCWNCDFKLQLKIAEVDSGDIVDEFLAWELLGEPVGKEIFEPLHSCDWSGIQGREGIGLRFSSLKAMHSSKGDGLYFHYEYS
jgi:hypothetical protein